MDPVLYLEKLHQVIERWHNYRWAGLGLLIIFSLSAWARYGKFRPSTKGAFDTPKVKTPTPKDEKVRTTTPDIELASKKQLVSVADTELLATQNLQPPSRARKEPKRVTGSKAARRTTPPPTGNSSEQPLVIQLLVFFSSLTGSTEAYTKTVVEDFKRSVVGTQILEARLHDLSYIEYDDYFLSTPRELDAKENIRYFYLILVPTYNIDTMLDTFILHLQETHHDFRVDTAPLANLLGYSVFGFGDKEGWPTEEEGFCSQAKEIDRWMAKLTNRKRAFPLGLGDVKSDVKQRLKEWQHGVEDTLRTITETGSLGEGVPGSGDALESDEDEIDDDTSSSTFPNATRPKKRRQTSEIDSTLNDLEDIGGISNLIAPSPLPIDFTTTATTTTTNTSTASLAPSTSTTTALKPMVPSTSPTYTSLTKQGYSIIGTHSGVKICRWTKSALRGRGSCYKHSFYGIASHLCMEATPSLSCSNKCIFCWRHGTNPVGTTWRWQTDPPSLLLSGFKTAHLAKIKALKGVPGVRAERFQEAQTIRHCALSLVGEPIFYPHINELLALLHKERISSFLVCNAQHPDQLAALGPVTQLYVSIDASNKESLRKIDRPLHRDFWERFTRCLDILRERRSRTRTVFRLTLVKGFNIEDEVKGYADLVERALPGFIEIKGVTYCGTSTAAGAGLTMQNVPFWEEVSEFVVALEGELIRRGLGYGIAAEHRHSCCVLLADEGRFKVQGKWRTVIDYERFFELVEEGREFGPEEYVGAETAEWALWGNGGFDPRDERVDRRGRKVEG